MALFKTSREAKDILETFRRATGGLIRPNLWARAALGYSLSLDSHPEDHYDSDGTEFQDRVFFGDDEDVLLALIREHIGHPVPNSDISSILKLHVERGLRLFFNEYKRLNKRSDELVLFLVGQCLSSASASNTTIQKLLPKLPVSEKYEITFTIGIDSDGNPVHFTPNAQGQAPHLAIMGRNGTGKTRTGLSLLQSVNASAEYQTPMLIFDYAKGDIAANETFSDSINAQIICLPSEGIPLTPLAIQSYDQTTIRLAARRFRDTINSVVRLGPVQKDRCLTSLERLYLNHKGRTPDLVDLTKFVTEQYLTNNWKEDSLIACLRDFSHFPLFLPSIDVGENHDFFKRSYIIDLHRLPEDLRKLTTFLMLDYLYSEIMVMPDAPLDNAGNRLLRQIIVIDEAHHYLPCKQETLSNMIREVRSKGIAIWLFSQSPDDFDQPGYNFVREMGLSIVFACLLEKPKMLESLLGGRIDTRRLSQLPPGHALVRLPERSGPIEIKAWHPA